MKKSVVLLLVLALVLAFTVVVPAFAVDYVAIEVDGVPTLYIPKEGIPVLSGDGVVLDSISRDDVILVGVNDFDEEEQRIYDELLQESLLPVYFQDKSAEDKDMDVDSDSVSLIFDFYLEGDSSEILDVEDSTAAELRFDVESKVDTENLLIAQYINGKWSVLDPNFYSYSDNVLDIKLENEGMLAFFAYRRVQEEPEPTPDVVYRPSVFFRAYPETVESEPGYYYVLESVYAKFDEPMDKIPASEIKLYAAKTFTGEKKAAYDALATADPLSSVCDNLNEVLEDAYPGVSEGDLVVRDVFELALGSKAEELLNANDDCCLILHFRYSINEGDTFVVLQYLDGEWVALDADCVAAQDGMVSVKVHNTGLLAFVVEG